MEVLISVQLNEITKTKICLDYKMCSSHYNIITCNILLDASNNCEIKAFH